MFLNTIKNILGVAKPITAFTEIAFYRDAAYYGEHGRIVVSSPKHELKEHEIAFVFKGKTRPPELDLHVMAHIWEQALEQGFVPHSVASYGAVFAPSMTLEESSEEVASPSVWASRRNDVTTAREGAL